MTTNIDNLTDQELSHIVMFARGMIHGIRDTHDQENADFELRDYWCAFNDRIDMNIMHDPDTDKHILCLYPVFNMIRDDSTFQRITI